jgi:hypothetical protein
MCKFINYSYFIRREVMKERKRITLTMKLYKHRLGQMITNYSEEEISGCCPAKLGFVLLTRDLNPPIDEAWINDPCEVCRDFMEIPCPSCPCGYYGCKKAIKLAKKKLGIKED